MHQNILPCKTVGFEMTDESVSPACIVKLTKKRLMIEENQCILKIWIRWLEQTIYFNRWLCLSI